MDDEEVLDSVVVERILRRASELSSTRTTGTDPSSGVSAAALLAAAEEVGLPIAAVRRSIAIEQLGPLPAARRSDRIVGRRIVVVDDEIRGTPNDVLERIDGWLVDGHHLRRDRLRADSAEWSKRTGSVNAVKRSVRSATGTAPLGEFERIKAYARQSEPGSTVVRIAVDRTNSRRAAAGGGAAFAVGGTAGLVVGAVVATPFLLLITPVTVLGGLAIAMTARSRATKTEHEVERLLESVDQGVAPTKLRNDLVKRMTGLGRGGTALSRGIASAAVRPPAPVPPPPHAQAATPPRAH